MKRLKTFLIYALCIGGFFLLSNLLIYVGLNSTYHTMERKDELRQVVIYQAESTSVNGRIRGLIDNQEKNLAGKFLRVDLYSKRNVYLGKVYYEILSENENIPFELFFKIQNASSYEMKIVDEKEEGKLEIKLLDKNLSRAEILALTLFSVMMFW